MPKLMVGDVIPNFIFNTAYENGKAVEDVIKNKKWTIFWVLRYIGCTTCRYDVHVMAERYQDFLDLNTQIFVVMQSDPAIVREDLMGSRLPFDIICDTDMEIYKRLEIPAAASKADRIPTNPVDLARLKEKKKKVKEAGIVHGKYEGNEQQLPAIFLVAQDGTVSYAHYAKHSIDMPTVDEMLAILKDKGKMGL